MSGLQESSPRFSVCQPESGLTKWRSWRTGLVKKVDTMLFLAGICHERVHRDHCRNRARRLWASR
jgi:hypothetical protein